MRPLPQALLAGLRAALLAAPLALAGPALAQSPFATPAGGTVFRGVQVDAGPLAERGNAVLASEVRRELTPRLREAFADRIDPRAKGAPLLVVRITAVQMQLLADGGVRSSGSGTQSDYMEGEALILPAGGRGQGRRVPMLASVDANANAGAAWYLPDNEPSRLRNISQFYASWMRRKLAGV